LQFPGPGQNSFYSSLQSTLAFFHKSKNWYLSLEPENDVEIVKNASFIPFAAAGGKRSIFMEEGLCLSEDITRNILMFLQKNQNIKRSLPLDGSVLLTVLHRNFEMLIQLIPEEKSITVKIGDINQVSLDEVNEVAKSVNVHLFTGLSLQQRQVLYEKKMNECVKYLQQKIETIFSMLVVKLRYY
jgi:hypothetical protein